MTGKRIVLAILSFALLLDNAYSETFPYQMKVTARETYVRSGPGYRFYPTSKIMRGETVEVYRRDPGGWLAIRPLPDSFSWVRADVLDVDSEGIGIVLKNAVASRTGSELGEKRDVIQVRLQKGEAVEVIGQKQLKTENEMILWYKIAPPAGEFRWVRSSDFNPENLTPQTKEIAEMPVKSEPLPNESRSVPTGPIQLTGAEEEVPAQNSFSNPNAYHPNDVKKSGTFKPVKKENASSDSIYLKSENQNAGPVRYDLARPKTPQIASVPDRSSANGGTFDSSSWSSFDEQNRSQAKIFTDSPRDNTITNSENTRLASTEMSYSRGTPEPKQNEMLDELSQDLTLLVTRSSRPWEYVQIERLVQQIYDDAASPLVRGRARRLLLQVDRFENIEVRQQSTVASLPPRPAPPANQQEKAGLVLPRQKKSWAVNPIAPQNSEDAMSIAEEEQRFDGVGYLVAVNSNNPKTPKYALLDSNRRLRHFLTPTTSLDSFKIRSNKGKLVGVTGTTSVMRDLNSESHIMVRQIEPLKSPLR